MKIKFNLKLIIIGCILAVIIICSYYVSYSNENNKDKNEALSNIKDYLSQNYDFNTTFNNIESKGDEWWATIKVNENKEPDFLVVWKKNSNPTIIFDSNILNYEWNKEATLSTGHYIEKDIYYNNFRMYLIFNCIDYDFMKSEKAASLNFKDVIERSKQKVKTEINLFVFVKDLNKEEEAIEVENIMNSELFNIYKNSDFQFYIYYLPTKYKQAYDEGKIENKIINSQDELEKVHDDGILLDWLIITKNDTTSKEIKNAFHY